MIRNELQVPTMLHPVGHALAGEPDIPQYVQRFAERWRALIHDGSIKQSQPRKRVPPAGNRVDAMMVSTVVDSSMPGQATPSSVQTVAYVAQQLRNEAIERMCWNCRGFGHTKVDANNQVVCPSPIKTRSIASAIAMLEIYKRREAGRGGRRKVFIRKPGAAAAKSAIVDQQEELMEVLVDDDGTIYSMEGAMLGTLAETGGYTTERAEQSGAGLASISESAPALSASNVDSVKKEDGMGMLSGQNLE